MTCRIVNTVEPKTVEFAQLVGRNVKRLRAQHSMDALASATRGNGAVWDSGAIAKVERGQFKIGTVPALVLLAASLTDLLGRKVGIADLIESESLIHVSDTRAVSSTDLMRWFAGEQLALFVTDDSSDAEYVADIERWAAGESAYPVPKVDKIVVEEVVAAQTLSDERVARTLELPNVVLASWSAALWGQTFTARRDELAGPDANAQKRGRITRELKTELQQAMSAHGND